MLRVLLLSAMVILMLGFLLILVRMLIGPGAADRLLAGSYAAGTLTAVLLIEVVLSGRVQIVPAVFLFALLSFACGLSAVEVGPRTSSSPETDPRPGCAHHQTRRTPPVAASTRSRTRPSRDRVLLELEPCTC